LEEERLCVSREVNSSCRSLSASISGEAKRMVACQMIINEHFETKEFSLPKSPYKKSIFEPKITLLVNAVAGVQAQSDLSVFTSTLKFRDAGDLHGSNHAKY